LGKVQSGRGDLTHRVIAVGKPFWRALVILSAHGGRSDKMIEAGLSYGGGQVIRTVRENADLHNSSSGGAYSTLEVGGTSQIVRSRNIGCSKFPGRGRQGGRPKLTRN